MLLDIGAADRIDWWWNRRRDTGLRIMQVLFIFPSTGPLLLMAIRMLQVPHGPPIPLIMPDHPTNDIHSSS